ncbi:MAG: type II toxin-antitoxin system HigB family toxin [Cyanobacteria bacterium J06638_22]
MKVVGRNRLQAFGVQHTDARDWLNNWLAEVELASWDTPHDVKAQYASASLLGKNTVIFNVKGNHYRLEVTIAYQTKVVVVVWVGTHSEYDKRNQNR